MTVRPLRLFGDPVLTTVAAPVAEFDDGLRRLVADMLETMDAAGGVGLAANQIGIARRVFVFDCQGMRGAIINPVWAPLDGSEQVGPEGCLSIPGIRADVARHNTLVASGADAFGRPLAIRATGLLARCIQHESDHLDGVLFLSRMEPAAKKQAMAQIRATDWFTA